MCGSLAIPQHLTLGAIAPSLAMFCFCIKFALKGVTNNVDFMMIPHSQQFLWLSNNVLASLKNGLFLQRRVQAPPPRVYGRV